MEINTPVIVAIAIIALWIGFHINRRVSFLHTYNIPPAVTGGLLISALVAVIETTTARDIRFDLQLRDLLPIAFFSTIGLSARLRQMMEGGKALAIMLGLAIALLIFQNLCCLAWICSRVSGGVTGAALQSNPQASRCRPALSACPLPRPHYSRGRASVFLPARRTDGPQSRLRLPPQQAPEPANRE